MKKGKFYNKLFCDIYKIGIQNTTGISYNELISELKEKGYTLKRTEESTIKNWFINNFAHSNCNVSEEQKKFEEENKVFDLEKHLLCKWCIRSDSYLSYLIYQNTKNDVRYYNIVIGIVIICFLIAILDLLW